MKLEFVFKSSKTTQHKKSWCFIKYCDEVVYGGVEVWVHAFLTLSTGCIWVVSFMSQWLYPRGYSQRHQLYRRLGGPQGRSGRYGEGNNLSSLSEIKQRTWNVMLVGWAFVMLLHADWDMAKLTGEILQLLVVMWTSQKCNSSLWTG
jgi:hypothetical protein